MFMSFLVKEGAECLLNAVVKKGHYVDEFGRGKGACI